MPLRADSPSFQREAYEAIAKLEADRRDMLDRIERMTRTMEELRTSKFSVGAIHMRYPNLDYALQITPMYQTSSGQVIIVAPLPFAPNPKGQSDG